MRLKPLKQRSLAVLASMAAFAACSDPTGLGDARFESDRFAVTASFSPTDLAAGGTSELVVLVRNTGGEPLQLTSSVGCPLFLGVFEMRSQRPVSMDGASFACTLLASTWTIPAGDSVTWRYRLAARVDGRAMRAGAYVAEVDFITTPEVPVLRVPFSVQ